MGIATAVHHSSTRKLKSENEKSMTAMAETQKSSGGRTFPLGHLTGALVASGQADPLGHGSQLLYPSPSAK